MNRHIWSPRLRKRLTGSSQGGMSFFYWLTRLTFGKRIEPARFALTQWLFLRVLAAIYIVAFASLAVQVTGLLGEHGILAGARFLRPGGRRPRLDALLGCAECVLVELVRQNLGGHGVDGSRARRDLTHRPRLERLALSCCICQSKIFRSAWPTRSSCPSSGMPCCSKWDSLAISLRTYQNHAKDHRVAVSLAGVPLVFPVRLCEVSQP